MTKKNTRHVFYTLPENTLREIISKCTSLSQVFEYLDLCKTGPQYRVLKQRIKELDINTSHFIRRVMNGKCEKRPIEFYLVENATGYSTHTLKLRLIKEGLLKNECSECHNDDQWNNKILSLQLDHINGIRDDNRLENLRILCPNCHSQTKTFSGKKHKKHSFCPKCGNEKTKPAKICQECSNENNIEILKQLPHFQLINWPPKDELEKLVWTKTQQLLAKDFNASAKGLAGHCQKIGVKLPPKGYWIRIKHGHSHESALNPPKKIRNPKKLFTFKQIEEIKYLLSIGLSCRKIGKKFNVNHRAISGIKNGTSYNSDRILKMVKERSNSGSMGVEPIISTL